MDRQSVKMPVTWENKQWEPCVESLLEAKRFFNKVDFQTNEGETDRELLQAIVKDGKERLDSNLRPLV